MRGKKCCRCSTIQSCPVAIAMEPQQRHFNEQRVASESRRSTGRSVAGRGNVMWRKLVNFESDRVTLSLGDGDQPHVLRFESIGRLVLVDIGRHKLSGPRAGGVSEVDMYQGDKCMNHARPCSEANTRNTRKVHNMSNHTSY